MPFYHGSPVGELNELKPFLSEHEKQYVYFTQNPIVALLYAVHPVDKPFSYYPYGFDKDGTVHYSEYYQNAFGIFTKEDKDICMNAIISHTSEILRRLTASLSVRMR